MESAKSTLRYYLKTVWEQTGLKWTSDNDAEVDDILQAVFETAREDLATQHDIEVTLRQHGLIV